MKRLVLGVLFFLISISLSASVDTVAARKNYPYPLLTDDYGILNENDLAAYTWGMKPRPFSDKEMSGSYYYWQCFPRDTISITLEDTGYSSKYVNRKDTLSELKIEVWAKHGVVHRYAMRAWQPFHRYEKEFHLWHKLMTGERYVCLAGSFDDKAQKIENGKTILVYSWTYKKIKTKKGCDGYWDDCEPTYEKYLKNIKDEAKLNNRDFK